MFIHQSLEKIIDLCKDSQSNCENIWHTFLSALDEAVIFTDSELTILAGNKAVSMLLGLPVSKAIGMKIINLIAPKDHEKFGKIFENNHAPVFQKDEFRGISYGGRLFPMEVTVRQIDLDSNVYYFFIIRDTSDMQLYEEKFLREKKHRREMYITLRNVMQTVEIEKNGSEKMAIQKIETLMIPTLEKIKKETSIEMRNLYLDLLKDQLLRLTKGFSQELDAHFLLLSPTEMRICRLIQNGFTGKEIADKMNIAFDTVQTHRKNIRKKLGLKKRKINLYAFLKTQRRLDSFTHNK